MQLNLPILDQLIHSENILIAGAGGGQDVLAGLPIYFTLRDLGKNVHLANYSFVEFDLLPLLCEPEIVLENQVFGVRGPIRDITTLYFPEGYLAHWFKTVRDEDVSVWMFRKTGAGPLAASYRALVEHLHIDAILLVDGGVDSIMRGDEAGPGTLLEDSITLTAIDPLDVPVKLLACIGFGTEVEEEVCHHNALENIAALAKAGGFLGNCALLPQMAAFQQFEAACRYIWEDRQNPQSHITTRVIPAAQGEFGNFQMYPAKAGNVRVPIFVSPLMSLYWFFDARKVIERSLIIDLLRDTETTREAFNKFFVWHRTNPKVRPRQALPY